MRLVKKREYFGLDSLPQAEFIRQVILFPAEFSRHFFLGRIFCFDVKFVQDGQGSLKRERESHSQMKKCLWRILSGKLDRKTIGNLKRDSKEAFLHLDLLFYHKIGENGILKIRTNRGLSVLQPMNTTSLFVSNHFMNLVLRYFMFDSGDSIEDVHQSLRDIFCTLCAKCQAIFFVISKALKAAKSLPIGRSPTEMPPRSTVIFKKQKRVGGNNKSSFEGGPLESLLRSFESKKSSRKPLPSKSQNISET